MTEIPQTETHVNIIVTSLWSSYGHNFQSNSSDDSETCMLCGGTWTLLRYADADAVAEAETDGTGYCMGRGEYVGGDGEYATYCRPSASRHGEAPCEALECQGMPEYWDSGDCEHVARDCNCLLCSC